LVIFATNDRENIEAVEEDACKYLVFEQARQTGHHTGSAKNIYATYFTKYCTVCF
jgi:hypothetical protein